jgi:hypothetical protein
MPLIANIAAFQRKLADLPLALYEAGEAVLTAGSTTGRLLILNEGAVAVVKEGVEIGRSRRTVPCSANCPCCWIGRTRRM